MGRLDNQRAAYQALFAALGYERTIDGDVPRFHNGFILLKPFRLFQKYPRSRLSAHGAFVFAHHGL